MGKKTNLCRVTPVVSMVLIVLSLIGAIIINTPSIVEASVETSRIYGQDRYATAVAISKQGWPDGAETVLVARGDDYADALAGAPLAYRLDAPILLTPTGSLHPATITELARLGAGRVIILGGNLAVSAQVEKEILAAGISTVERIAGADRFDTAARIALALAPQGVEKAVVAYGYNFPDALAAAAYAAREGFPILLTAKDTVPTSTQQAIAGLDVKNTIVVGGTSVISEKVLKQLPQPDRISGVNRFVTAVEIAKYFDPQANHFYAATGLGFADAITGGVLAAKTGSGILLVGSFLPAAMQQLLMDREIVSVTIFGGYSAVSQEVENDLAYFKDLFAWSFMPATQKIFPDTVPGSQKSAALYGAKNEYLNIQVVLLAKDHLTVPASCSFGELFEAKYIDTPGTTEWGQWRPEHKLPRYPDPLPPASEIQLAPGEARSLWVRVRATESLQGVVRIDHVSAPVSVTVWPWEMPAAPSLKTSVGLGGGGFIKVYKELYGYEMPGSSDAFWSMYEQYYNMLLDYRLSAYTPPYGAGSSQAEKYLTDPRVTSFRVGSGMDSALWQRLGKLGVRHKALYYDYRYDEPTSIAQYDIIRNDVNTVRALYPGIRCGVFFYHGAYQNVPYNPPTPYEHMSGAVNVWIPQIDYYTHGHAYTGKVRQQTRERWLAGDEIWAYTALAPRGDMPNILLNNTALEHRLLFWQLYASEVFSGYFYWHTTYWNEIDNPWEDQGTTKGAPGLWGDGSLFYPLPDGPCGSIRLEMIRAGLQDYELLLKAETVLGRPAVISWVEKVIRDFDDYTRDPALFEAVRVELGEALAKKL